jgi:hypothetical protein
MRHAILPILLAAVPEAYRVLPVEMTVPAPPAPVRAGGKARLVYELRVTNLDPPPSRAPSSPQRRVTLDPPVKRCNPPPASLNPPVKRCNRCNDSPVGRVTPPVGQDTAAAGQVMQSTGQVIRERSAAVQALLRVTAAAVGALPQLGALSPLLRVVILPAAVVAVLSCVAKLQHKEQRNGRLRSCRKAGKAGTPGSVGAAAGIE